MKIIHRVEIEHKMNNFSMEFSMWFFLPFCALDFQMPRDKQISIDLIVAFRIEN